MKWISTIKWIHDYADYGDGRGGTGEDARAIIKHKDSVAPTSRP